MAEAMDEGMHGMQMKVTTKRRNCRASLRSTAILPKKARLRNSKTWPSKRLSPTVLRRSSSLPSTLILPCRKRPPHSEGAGGEARPPEGTSALLGMARRELLDAAAGR
jgi:hypothetical protein